MKRCNDCGVETWEPGDSHDGSGIPVTLGGQRHRSTCRTIPQLSPEAEHKLYEDLAAMDRLRRRAAAESRNIWIG